MSVTDRRSGSTTSRCSWLIGTIGGAACTINAPDRSAAWYHPLSQWRGRTDTAESLWRSFWRWGTRGLSRYNLGVPRQHHGRGRGLDRRQTQRRHRFSTWRRLVRAFIVKIPRTFLPRVPFTMTNHPYEIRSRLGLRAGGVSDRGSAMLPPFSSRRESAKR
jgi:hypothetical protein